MKKITFDRMLIEARIYNDVVTERQRQDEMWGDQNHYSDGTDPMFEIDREAARSLCNAEARKGETNWTSILLEEVFEAVSEYEDTDKLRAELIQVAAVSVAWIESIDRRGL